MTRTTEDTRRFFTATFSNAAHFVTIAIRATDEGDAREKAEQYAEDELTDAAQDEYKMALADDRYDPDRSDWTYTLDRLEEAGYELNDRQRKIMQRRGDDARMIKSGGNG